MRHAELHVHDMFSVLDGASTPEEYMVRAKEIGLTHIAQTNHGTNSGHREFLRQAQKAGITPILGQEAYITNDRFDRRGKAQRQDGTSIYNHITLLALNPTGLENLDTLSRIGWTEGYYYKPRIDLEVLEEYNEGIVALSGCMSGMIAKAIEAGDRKAAEELAQEFKRIFGDRFYMEVMESNDKSLNQKLVRLGKKYDIPPVVTSDCHMASKDDLWLAEAMLILNTDPKRVTDFDRAAYAKSSFVEKMNYMYPDRTMSFREFELFLHTYDEHMANLEKHGIDEEALTNTMVIAEMVEEYPYHEGLDLLPELYENPDEVLREKVYAGLKERGLWENEEARKQVDEVELPTIQALGLSNYFLIEEDVCRFADANDILRGYGRGSAVSYVTNYALGITKINPLPYNLLPERFISIDRADPADIDTDFAIDGRYRVKKYVEQKYGNVSNIATVTYYKHKSAIKAAAKVVGVPYAVSTKIGSMIESIQDYETLPALADVRKQYPDLAPLAKALVGRIQSMGMHAGGTIISREPIENYVPVVSNTDPSDESAGRVPVAALDMRELADIGFVKYDFLGLRTLSIVDDAMKLIKERHGVDIDIENIPLDDKNIYDMISQGHTTLLFQAEQSASTRAILAMGGTQNFNHLVASNALVRPGAANSSVGSTYIKGKLTGETNYIHPDTVWFTEETFGAILYQEQQLLLCEHIAGMSKAHANKVRKAISKKIPEDLAIWKDEFVAGAAEKLGQAGAERVWKDLEASADYAFAKAHAVGYSMLTLLTAYLKYYYPLEYITSAIGRLTNAKSDRMKMLMYLIEAKRLGIRIKMPHINASDIHMSIQTDEQGDYIRFGLSNIKGIGDKTAKKILEDGPYESYEHILKKAEEKYSPFRSNVLAAMNKVGAAAFEDNPRTGREHENFYEYLNVPAISFDLPAAYRAQFTTLVEYDEARPMLILAMAQGVTRKNGWQRVDFVDETGTQGIFTTPNEEYELGKVYVLLVSNNTVIDKVLAQNLEGSNIWRYLRAESFPTLTDDHLKVIAFYTRMTKAGKRMAEVVLADHDKNLIGAKVWPTQYPQAHTMLKPGHDVALDFKELEDGLLAVDRIL